MNKQTAIDFFNTFLTDPDEKITVRCIRDRNKTGDPMQDATKGKCGTVAELMPVIEKRNADTWGAFFVVNSTGTDGTKDADVTHARALFIDIDGTDCPEYFPLEPSAILRRSDGGGFHIYWFLSEPETSLENWTAAQKILIRFYKSDPVIHNPARIMRIPGTVNHKEKCDSPMYEIESLSGKRYTTDKIIYTHSDPDKMRKGAISSARALFKSDEKLVEGDGRHNRLVKASFILNDYGFSPEDTFSELKKIILDTFDSPISDEKIKSYVTAQKSAQNAPGSVSVEKALLEQAKIDRVKELVKEWYYVRQQDFFFQNGSSVPVTSVGFNAKFAYSFGVANPTRFVFQHDCIKQYESLIYDPGLEQDAQTVGGVDRNMYEPTTLEPIDNTPQWFLDHIAYLMPVKEEREHFLRYLAYLIQHPGKKVMHGVLIVGKQGIGKSILQKVFSAVFGESNVVAPHNENLTGQFTGWAKHCQIVVINELMQVDKKDFNNKIKPFITEPHVEIREMYKAPYVIKNCMNIIAFSNHDNAVYVEKDDRRWFIIKSDAVKKEAEYYDTLIDKMNTCSGEVLNYLQNLDISEFREGAAPPMTAAKRDIIEYSTPDLDAWITETIESCAAPCDADIITIDDLRNALPRQLQNGYATANRIGKILRDCNCIRSTERITVGGVKKRFWVLRNYDKYKSLEQLKSAVSTTYGGEGVESNQFVS